MWTGAVQRTENAVLLPSSCRCPREDGLAVVENGDRRMRWSLFSSGGFELLDAFQSFCSQFGSIACDRELTATLDLG